MMMMVRMFFHRLLFRQKYRLILLFSVTQKWFNENMVKIDDVRLDFLELFVASVVFLEHF